jgi:hypothetical protein
LKGCGETTSPGHKRSQHLIEAEAYRRITAGDAPATLNEFAQQLLDWLRQSYPDASPTTVEAAIRETWHRRHELIQGGEL